MVKKYVLAGGPCYGKTTLVKLAKQIGYPVVEEAASKVMEIENAKGGDVLPDKKPAEFQIATVNMQIALEALIENKDDVFLDRGVCDNLGYCRFYGIDPPPKEVIAATKTQRYDAVFVLELLPRDRYGHDKQRRESYEEAEEIHRQVRQAYLDSGYKVVDVPVLPPEERMQFVLGNISRT